MFTKKQYEAAEALHMKVAEIIQAAQPAKHPCKAGSMEHGRQSGSRSTCEHIARNFADMFEQNNQFFDRARFMKACGFTE